ncbi:hypothetical protein OG949_17210 [Streptomyces scopuliridis]|uniref:hypothetical protein n=1 Tax=Streptomyces scopuliridis TaxID=452529 RepID=UPI002DDACE99|nr:hypothetical protein [Streptomyces scopuliridis]WSB34440.1 hypothetical protein OG949_17210 [Streptomyces scopuliridis]
MGRRRPEPDQGHGSGISIGGSNNAPLQNVVGQNIAHVYQSASAQGTIGVEAVRDLLASFRSDVELNAPSLQYAAVLRVMADTVDTSLRAPDEHAGALRRVAQDLPGLVVGTAVQEGGSALANALGSLLS